MSSMQGWLRQIIRPNKTARRRNGAQSSATGHYRLTNGRSEPVYLELVIGGAPMIFALDDVVVSQVAEKWEPATNQQGMAFKMPHRMQRLLIAVHPLNLAAFTAHDDPPSFLIFDAIEPIADLERRCAFVVRTKYENATDYDEYHLNLNEPRPLMVPITGGLERINLCVRLAGEGVLPPVRINVGVPDGRQIAVENTKLIAAYRSNSSAPEAEFDWVGQLPTKKAEESAISTIAAQCNAMAVNMQALLRHTAILRRQVDDFTSAGILSSPQMAEPLGWVERGLTMTANAERDFRKAYWALIRQLEKALPRGENPAEMQPYRRVLSKADWRDEIVEKALPVVLEHGLHIGLAHIWRQAEYVEFRIILDDLAEALSAHEPALSHQCLVLSLGLNPTMRFVQRAAGKLFKWGMLEKAGEMLDQAKDTPETRFLGELRLAIFLRDNAASLIPAAKDTAEQQGEGIAYVASSSQPWSVAGYTTRTHELLSSLASNGEKVTCYTRPGFPWDRPNIMSADQAVNVDGLEVGDITYLHSATPFVEDDPQSYMLRAADVLVERFRANPPAIVHAASNYRNGLPALIAARRLGIPFVYEVRGLWELTAASRNPGWEKSERFAYERQMERLLVHEADMVLTITDAVRKELLPSASETANVRLLSNAVNPKQFRPTDRDERLAARLGFSQDDLVLVYAGSLVEYEGIDDVIDAVDILRKRDVPAKFVIVGDGRAREALEAQIKVLNLEEHVIMRGRVKPEQIRFYLSIADVVPITRKRFRVCELVSPLKPFEAMAMEKTVVVSDLPALCEIITDGERGRVCKAENPEDLARVLEELHLDPALNEAYGKASREWVVKHRSWEHHADKLTQIYDELRSTPA